MTFRGRDRSRGFGGSLVVPQPSTYFHFPIPTPVIVRGVRAQLLAAFVLWTADPGIALQEVQVFDGPNSLPVPFSTPVGVGRDGSGGIGDIVEGMTKFTLSGQEIFWGIGISLGFAFSRDGNVTFTTAGADFEIPEI
jgi:hypothetical protein